MDLNNLYLFWSAYLHIPIKSLPSSWLHFGGEGIGVDGQSPNTVPEWDPKHKHVANGPRLRSLTFPQASQPSRAPARASSREMQHVCSSDATIPNKLGPELGRILKTLKTCQKVSHSSGAFRTVSFFSIEGSGSFSCSFTSTLK